MWRLAKASGEPTTGSYGLVPAATGAGRAGERVEPGAAPAGPQPPPTGRRAPDGGQRPLRTAPATASTPAGLSVIV